MKWNFAGRVRKNGEFTLSLYCKNFFKKNIKCNNSRKISILKLEKIIDIKLNELLDKFVNKKYVINRTLEIINSKEKLEEKIKKIKYNIESYNSNLRDLYFEKTSGELLLDDFIEKKNIIYNSKNELEHEHKTLLNKKRKNIKKEEIIKIYSKFIKEEKICKYIVTELISNVIINKEGKIEIVFDFCINKKWILKKFI